MNILFINKYAFIRFSTDNKYKTPSKCQITMKPRVDDAELKRPLAAGGIFAQYCLCWQFQVAMHKMSIRHLRNLKDLRPDASDWPLILDLVKGWDRNDVLSETEDWLTCCSNLQGLFQFTVTKVIECYGGTFPRVREMGVKVPALTDAVLAYIRLLHEDPTVKCGSFLELGADRTMGIVLCHVSTMLLDIMTTLYFPEYSRATSVFARGEAEFYNNTPLETPVSARPLLINRHVAEDETRDTDT
jgi:hypothetical protein